jgi:hypothetical protein
MTILSKQQTSYTVKQTKPTEHFFKTHYCHVCNENLKTHLLASTCLFICPSGCPRVTIKTQESFNGMSQNFILETFTEIWLKILILVEM